MDHSPVAATINGWRRKDLLALPHGMDKISERTLFIHRSFPDFGNLIGMRVIRSPSFLSLSSIE
jgi:hypothetical protein